DPIFGLLGDAKANANAPDGDGVCLQQNTADLAITVANGDNTVIAAALSYRALERNTQSVGGVSKPCTKTPQNAILVGLSQHQDPASPNANAVNKAVEITLAKKLASIGANPLDALLTGTFAPGQIGDPTAKGLTCDDSNCIFSNNRLVSAATADEINAAV
ncbi:hypothetical protein BDK51DRAFT_8682, partial [Blyttiomyces helicus]